MERDVRYCTTEDGVRIAYSVEGDGPPLLFCHYVYAFSLSYIVPTYEDALRRIGRGHALIRYDMRGSGLSQREVDHMSIETSTLDIEAVVRALGLDRFILLGATSGGGRAIHYASRNPDRVSALILYEAYPRLLDAYPRELMEMFCVLARANWAAATRSLTDIATRTRQPEEQLNWMRLIQNSITGQAVAQLIDAQMDFDATLLLGQIACPTLVVHSRNDVQWPFVHGRRLAEGIPDARLVPLEGDAGGAFTDPDQAIEAIQAFLQEQSGSIAHRMGEEGGEVRQLTPRETEILRLIATGRTSKEISQELSLSVRTVGRHITNIYGKIGARTRADATAYALRHRLAED